MDGHLRGFPPDPVQWESGRLRSCSIMAALHDGRKEASRVLLQIEDMWPYWLDGAGPSTVRNSLTLDSMVLLTGEPCPHHRPRYHVSGVKQC